MSKQYVQGIFIAVIWGCLFMLCGCQKTAWKADSCQILVQQTTCDASKPAEEKAVSSEDRCLWLDRYHYLQTPVMALSERDEVLTHEQTVSVQNKRKSMTKTEIPAGECVDINAADATQLSKLPGVGQGRANQIIQARQKKAFKRKSDIMRIKGIGKKSYRKMAAYICEIV